MPTDAKPLIMCTRSIRAWQQGAKTQTRRLVRPQPPDGLSIVQIAWGWLAVPEAPHSYRLRQPYGVGDLLWIREALKCGKFGYVLYATHPFDYLREEDTETGWRWPWKRNKLPAMFMPRWACRYYARVVSVRPERLQDISDEDAEAEGVSVGIRFPTTWYHGKSRDLYSRWWAGLHAKPGTRWEDSPFVWKYTLEPVDNP